jgi:hypothetical protein
MNGVYVYIASPYTIGDTEANVRRSMDCADTLLDLGYHPFWPLNTHYLHINKQRPYQFWMKNSIAWLLKCDCVLRLPGESSGADAEVQIAKSEGIPVVYSIEEIEKIFRG